VLYDSTTFGFGSMRQGIEMQPICVVVATTVVRPGAILTVNGRRTSVMGFCCPTTQIRRLDLVTYRWRRTTDGETDVGAQVAFERIAKVAWAVDLR
jgi:hypothetical protein